MPDPSASNSPDSLNKRLDDLKYFPEGSANTPFAVITPEYTGFINLMEYIPVTRNDVVCMEAAAK